jgi:hypothetical protein
MTSPDQLETILQQVVGEVLESCLPELRAEIVRRASEQLRGAPGARAGGIPEVAEAVVAIQHATTQVDILGALLAGAGRFAGRAALFVVRAGAAFGWQARGIDERYVKNVQLGLEQGSAARVIAERASVGAPAREFDDSWIARIGAPADNASLVLPLVVRDKVAALLYTDAGPEGDSPVQPSAMDLLVRSASLWLEVLAVRKAAPLAAAHAEPERPVAEPAAVPAAVKIESPAAAAAPAPSPAAQPEDEIHNKARRFARVLVDEIKLYNKEKVAEGRQHRDLYDRLREDIDKSRATYDHRYGSTPVASADYFNKEIIRILAESDSSLLGGNFPG